MYAADWSDAEEEAELVEAVNELMMGDDGRSVMSLTLFGSTARV